MRDGSRPLLTRLLEGDLSCFGAPRLEETVAGRVRAEQMASVIRYTPGMMLANLSSAPILTAALWDTADQRLLCVWAALMLGLASLFFVRRIQRAGRPPPATVSPRAIRLTIRNALALGGLWSAVPLFFFGEATSGGQLIIACLVAGVLCSAAFGLASIPVAATAFTGPLFVSVGIAFASHGDPMYTLAALLLLVYAGIILRVVYSHGVQFATRLAAQIAVEHKVSTDGLTELLNRTGFQERFEAAFDAFRQGQAGFAVFCLDLDSFKAVNDTYGHDAGDELLVQAAARLKACAGPQDTCARLGGDEFAVIAPGLDRAQARERASQVIQSFEVPFKIGHVEICCGISIGIALAPTDGTDPRSLLKAADIALYQAKQSRGGSFKFFEARHNERERQRRNLEQELRQALHKGEFRLFYQPFLNLASNQVVGCEALLRWEHPLRGIILPSEFVPTAEETGLIGPIGEWIIQEACRTAAMWPASARVAVNLSIAQLRDPAIVPVVMRALAESGLAPERLEFEITETVLIGEAEIPFRILRRLSSLGIRIALDDFGTGYSSLSYLRKLPLHRIKIDRSFVGDMLSDADCASIVRAVIGLAADLNIATTAEGVETDEQLSWLKARACNEAQGYLISRPCPAEELTRFFKDDAAQRRAA